MLHKNLVDPANQFLASRHAQLEQQPRIRVLEVMLPDAMRRRWESGGEERNCLFCPSQGKFHTAALKGVRNISGTF